MKNINKDPKTTNRLPYQAPTINTFVIELEQGIAAGSGPVAGDANSGDLSEEWMVSDKDSRNMDW